MRNNYFHCLVIAGIVPSSIVWGGGKVAAEHIIAAELVSVVLNVLFAAVAFIKLGVLKLKLSERVVNGLFWCMAVLFLLNTVGNLLSDSAAERAIFTPVTLVLTVLCVVAAVKVRKMYH
ncbi:MAG: hypothetical protein ACRC3B_20500 [Bacteroidia bacterium]